MCVWKSSKENKETLKKISFNKSNNVGYSKNRGNIEKVGPRWKKPGAYLSVKGLMFGVDKKGFQVNTKKTNNRMKKTKGQEVETATFPKTLSP